MRGLILAAGRGSRLGGLTADRPKCLVPLAGRTLLEWQLAALSSAGVDDLAIVTGYRAELVAHVGLPTYRADRWAETNMVRSLLAAASWLEGEACVVSYSDIVYAAETVRRLADADRPLAIAYDPYWEALWRRRFDDPREDAETFRTSDGLVSEIGNVPSTTDEVEGQYMGLLRFTPRSWEATTTLLGGLDDHQLDRLDMTGLLQMLVRSGEPVQAVPCWEPWGEIDSAGDLAVCEQLVVGGALEFDGGREGGP